ncbi:MULTISPECIES: hypothetical protein [unclassified Moorena]|uniref:hypothetical protein n=1 Tax=unclassified Moorena TaxID=2683338 RepID=UPI0025FAC5A2|nr:MULTISPECIES: hypothetical protein [unclassified Moorena]
MRASPPRNAPYATLLPTPYSLFPIPCSLCYMYEFFKLINKLWNNHKQKIRHNYYRNQLGNIG